MKISSTPKETAPGLNKRAKSILYKAIGLDRTTPISPMQLHSLAYSHPNEDVRTAAKSALSKLAFKLKPV